MSAETTPISTAATEADRVVKRQKICSSKFSNAVDRLLSAINEGRDKLSAGGNESVLPELKQHVSEMAINSELHDHTKQLHGAIAKLGKALEKAFVSDICKAYRPVSFDQQTLDQVVAEHLFHEGKFAVGEAFIKEAGIVQSESLKKPFEAMHQVLKEIHAHNLAPALQWVEDHRQELQKQPQAAGFEFKLYRLNFLNTLQQQGHTAALQYARQHFARFKDSNMPEIQRLMGALCYTRRQSSSPYAELHSLAQWDDVAHEFTRQCCGLLGQAYESPLLVCVAAGSVALPTLLKLASKVAGQQQHEFKTAPQLPVDLELGKEFIFHSTFACPVSREQSTAENPPKMLPCGHVLASQSIQKIARGQVRTFKCPYCPAEATPQTCREIHFPDLLAAA